MYVKRVRMLTLNQVRRLRRVLLDDIGSSPDAIVRLLHEVDHPELSDALSDKLIASAATRANSSLWCYEHAIAAGIGNISKLEDALITGTINKIVAGYALPAALIKVAKIKNINVIKVQNAAIALGVSSPTTWAMGLQTKIELLMNITRVKGADIQKTLAWYTEIRQQTKSKAIKKSTDEAIDKITRSYKYRVKREAKPAYASSGQIQELINLVRVKTVHEV